MTTLVEERTVRLRDNATLYVETTLRVDRIVGEGLTNVTVTGPGRIIITGAIELRRCRTVRIEDVIIDAAHTGISVDGCRDVQISHVIVNAVNGIRVTDSENAVIAECAVYGYEFGTVAAGTFERAPLPSEGAGITLGRSRNVTVSTVVFEYCRGLALTGGLEDVLLKDISLTEVGDSPLMLAGALHGITISDVDVRFANSIQNDVRSDPRGTATTRPDRTTRPTSPVRRRQREG